MPRWIPEGYELNESTSMDQQKDEFGWDKTNAKYNCVDACIVEVKKQAVSHFANCG